MKQPERVPRKAYEAELLRLQAELVALQQWVRGDRARASSSSSRAATPPARAARSSGSPSTSTRASPASSRCRRRPSASAAQWYFQRYVEHLPAAGEIVLFDRSWYNRAGVERVMGFCTPRRVPPVPAPVPDLRAAARRGRHPAAQVLVLGQRRGAGAPLPLAASTTRCAAWKLSPMDLESITALGGLLAGQGRDVRAHRHPRGAVVRGRGRRQAARPAQHDRPPARRSVPYERRAHRPLELPPRPPARGLRAPAARAVPATCPTTPRRCSPNYARSWADRASPVRVTLGDGRCSGCAARPTSVPMTGPLLLRPALVLADQLDERPARALAGVLLVPAVYATWRCDP